MAAVVTRQDIADEFMQKVIYFNTFSGNPVSVAVAKSILSIIEDEELQENAREVGHYPYTKPYGLKEKYPLIGNIRGRGD